MIGYCSGLAIATSNAVMTISLDSNLQEWSAVNDEVMGGVSTGRMVETEGALRFEGQLSLENSGAFASVCRQVPGAGPVDSSSIRQVIFCLTTSNPGHLRSTSGRLG